MTKTAIFASARKNPPRARSAGSFQPHDKRDAIHLRLRGLSLGSPKSHQKFRSQTTLSEVSGTKLLAGSGFGATASLCTLNRRSWIGLDAMKS